LRSWAAVSPVSPRPRSRREPERGVALCERSSALGGRAVTQREQGFAFNIGPHALYCAREAMSVLKELDVRPRGGKPGAAGGFAIDAGGRHALPGGFFSLITTSLLSLPAKLEVASLLGSLQRIDTAPLEELSVEAGLGAPRPATRGAKPARRADPGRDLRQRPASPERGRGDRSGEARTVDRRSLPR
jgi:hypothetical protein